MDGPSALRLTDTCCTALLNLRRHHSRRAPHHRPSAMPKFNRLTNARPARMIAILTSVYEIFLKLNFTPVHKNERQATERL
jgi:hypothetical protein